MSYRQIYFWVRKYEGSGDAGLLVRKLGGRKAVFQIPREYESLNAKAEDFRLINMVNAVKIGMYRIEEGGAE